MRLQNNSNTNILFKYRHDNKITYKNSVKKNIKQCKILKEERLLLVTMDYIYQAEQSTKSTYKTCKIPKTVFLKA